MFVVMEYAVASYEGSEVNLRGLYTSREKALEGVRQGLANYRVEMPTLIEDTDTVFHVSKSRNDEHWFEILTPEVDKFHNENVSKIY